MLYKAIPIQTQQSSLQAVETTISEKATTAQPQQPMYNLVNTDAVGIIQADLAYDRAIESGKGIVVSDDLL